MLGLGLYDYFQTAHSIPRNFPLIGRMRYLMEFLRPEIYQYFIENDTEGVPFDRDQRSLVYQRAKRVRDTVPFGTKEDVYAPGYEWLNHSMARLEHHPYEQRVTIGGEHCARPYSSSLLNISAMSYGSLSGNAILALSQGAKLGHGGILPAAKLTAEIAAIRHVPLGADVISPSGHSSFSTPVKLLQVVASLRELSGGKPVGF